MSGGNDVVTSNTKSGAKTMNFRTKTPKLKFCTPMSKYHVKYNRGSAAYSTLSDWITDVDTVKEMFIPNKMNGCNIYWNNQLNFNNVRNIVGN